MNWKTAWTTAKRLSPTANHELVREAMKENNNAKDVHQATGVRVSVHTMKNVVQDDDPMH